MKLNFKKIVEIALWVLIAIFAFWPALFLLGLAVAIVLAVLCIVAVISIILLPVALLLWLLSKI